MSAPAWSLGLAWLARVLDRDLQRAARAAGGPAALWRADRDRLQAALRVDGGRLDRARREMVGFDAARSAQALAEAGIGHVAPSDPAWPRRLGEIYDPPFGLFLRGDATGALAALAEGPVVAVVGSRRASAAGLRLARDLGRDLAARGAVVVSGLAHGVDGAAHEGALEAGGVTVAVLGTGVDVGYPRRHRGLAERVRAAGALISEYWPGTPPAPWRFPARNRVVSGLSQAVVVVEAGRRSGALITADFALEQGRPVLAVPGFPGAAGSAGCNALLRAGAALCEGVEDVVAELGESRWRPAPATPEPPQGGLPGRVHERLLVQPLRADELAGLVGADPAQVAAALAVLELHGHVLRGEGQRYWAAPRAAPGAA